MNSGEYEDEQRELKSIAATLIALALLTEFLCVLPLRIRLMVLALLWPAEAVARAFAFEQTGGALALPPSKVPGTSGDGCAEALRLARCFRVLASVLGGLHGSLAGRRLFRTWPHGRLLQRAPALSWHGDAMKAEFAMAFRVAGRLDTL